LDEDLQEQLRWAVTTPFYAERLRTGGLDPLRVRSVADLAALPFTEKDELRRSQAEHPPLGGNQGAPLERIVRMQATGGTTGDPMRIGFTAADLRHLDAAAARCLRFAGMGPGDLVVQCMNYSLYVGGVTDHMAFEAAGCCVLPYGVGRSRGLLALTQAMGVPWCLYSTPAYALRLAQVAREAALEPRALGLAKAVLSGDVGLGVPGFRDEIEATWGLVARDIYGLSETGFVAAERDPSEGLVFLANESLVVELVDPDSGRVKPVASGVEGELVFTTLHREASPLVRFRSHDVVRIGNDAPPGCPPGAFAFELLGRSDEMFIVRGVNVFPLAVQEVVSALRPAATGRVQIVLTKAPPIDYDPLVRVEHQRGIEAEELVQLGERLRREIQSRLNFSARIELVQADGLAPGEGKVKRLVRAYEEVAA
jgi:phenylacetate-CoA ligase